MKSFTVTLCLFALACNAALASVSGVVYCVNKAAGELCDFAANESSDSSDDCCPLEQAPNPSRTPLPFECELCIDFHIDESADDEATPSLERIVVKSVPVLLWSSSEFTITRGAPTSTKSLPVRAPPTRQRASQQYATTVQFRC